MKIFLVWLIVTTAPDGSLESHVYESQMTSTNACIVAQKKLDEKLLAEGYENFTTACESRVVTRR